MDLKQLAEGIDEIREDAIMEADRSKGDAYGEALAFFRKKVLPDGSKWGGNLSPKLGFDNEPKRTKEKKKQTKDGIQYSARLRVAPGKGGGAGVGVDPAASNHLFNMMGTDKKSVSAVSKAFSSIVKRSKRGVNEGLRVWLKKPDNFLHHIVGWNERKNWTIEDVSFKGIRYENPMVDPDRRLWPAGRTEIWQPITADVVITVKRKKK